MDAAELTLYQRYRWTVYGARERCQARLGGVDSLRGAVPGRRHGSLLPGAELHGIVEKGRFVEAPAALRAVNLQTGAEMWKSAVLETSFQATVPLPEPRGRINEPVGMRASKRHPPAAFNEPFKRATAPSARRCRSRCWSVPPGAVVARTASLPVPSGDRDARTALFARAGAGLEVEGAGREAPA